MEGSQNIARPISFAQEEAKSLAKVERAERDVAIAKLALVLSAIALVVFAALFTALVLKTGLISFGAVSLLMMAEALPPLVVGGGLAVSVLSMPFSTAFFLARREGLQNVRKAREHTLRRARRDDIDEAAGERLKQAQAQIRGYEAAFQEIERMPLINSGANR